MTMTKKRGIETTKPHFYEANIITVKQKHGKQNA